MDPLTQAVLGAALPQSLAGKSEQRVALAAGALGGAAPDLDVFIRSSSDPLLFFEFHRQFTHSLAFIPFGGLIVTLVLYFPFRAKWGISFSRLYVLTTLGFATHGLLDACTSYGTMLLWPFTNMRVAWNNVGIVDPVPTLTLTAAVIIAAVGYRRKVARAGLAFFLAYLLFGVLQHHRGLQAQEEILRTRGHEAKATTVKPTIGNLVLWRSIYEAGGRYYVDAIRVGMLGGTRVYPGESLEKLDVDRDFPQLPKDSVQFRDIGRFSWFSDGYLGRVPERPGVIGDVRFSLLPNEIEPLWGIAIDPARADQHVRYVTFRTVERGDWVKFFQMIKGADIP